VWRVRQIVPAQRCGIAGTGWARVTPGTPGGCPHRPGSGGEAPGRGVRRDVDHATAGDARHAPGVIAGITAIAISGAALGCSFALADGLMSKSPIRGHSTMKNHRSLRHGILQAGGPAGGAHRAPSAGITRGRAKRGILVLALSLGSLGAVALALPGHASEGPAQVSAHQRAVSPAHPAGLDAVLSNTTPRPWMW
jgi:hypothetical protein